LRYAEALAASSSLKAHGRPGLQALGADSSRVTVKNTRSIRGSINVESCQLRIAPRENAWDYGVGIEISGDSDGMIWLEVHSANSEHVQTVIDKLDSLLRFLREHAPALNKLPRAFVWLATGRVQLSPNSTSRRRINARGIVLRSAPLALDGLVPR